MARTTRRSGGRLARCRSAILTLSAAGVLAALLLVPADGVASDRLERVAGDSGHAALPGGAADSVPFTGVPAVGALFTKEPGGLRQHFCTASVVHSPAGDLALTAAHCFEQKTAGETVFVPGYHDGAAPYGIWQVARVYTDGSWQSSQDQDDDVAFLRLAKAPDGVPVEDVTGAERLGNGSPGHAYVQVIGYPVGAREPVWCANWAETYSATQQEFDCGGYAYGTSGGPFLAGVSGVTGEGTIIGVIGGYQQGGDTPAVSYSIAFGPEVAALFRKAEAGG